MGLTIHYSLRARTTDPDKARDMLNQAREIARDLPFKKVGRVFQISGARCNFEANRDYYKKHPAQGWAVLHSLWSVRWPWNKRISCHVDPLCVLGFSVDVGDGCEPLDVALALHPETVEIKYDPYEDQRFQKKNPDPRDIWNPRVYCYKKFSRWTKKEFGRYTSPYELRETRQVPTRAPKAWHGGGFVKTEYANNPALGGLPHFLRCHVAVVTFLERCHQRIKGLSVQINDEGRYGRSHYTDDWKVPKPVYTWHEPTHSIEALSREIGESGKMLAALFGPLQTMAQARGQKLVMPITQRPDFEHLEAAGVQLMESDEQLRAFFHGMCQVAQRVRNDYAPAT